MRILYIAGFFASVLDEIQNSASARISDRSVIWIPQRRDKNNQLDLNALKADLLGQAKQGAAAIQICCFIFRGQEHVLTSLETIREWAIARHPGLEVTIKQYKNGRDAVGLVEQIQAFRPTREVGFPDSLSLIEGWNQQNCGGRVLLHPRAIRGAKDSNYSDVPLIYRALKLLAEPYWNLRTSLPENRAGYQAALQSELDDCGIELAPSISDTRGGEQGEDYKVTYPFGSASRRDLELHLKKGSDRDQRNCLRIYFFWDSEARTSVIGWLTSHLGTRAS